MPQLEKDPLLSVESDTSVDLKQLSGYTLKSQSTFLQRDKDRVNISEGSKKVVDKYKEKFLAKIGKGKASKEASNQRQDSHITEENASAENAPESEDVTTGNKDDSNNNADETKAEENASPPEKQAEAPSTESV